MEQGTLQEERELGCAVISWVRARHVLGFVIRRIRDESGYERVLGLEVEHEG